MTKEFWDARYDSQEYIFGSQPNVFFKSVLDGLTPGKILIPGAGEGRDAVYAASKGWEVICLDLSVSGWSKALRLATRENVRIDYRVGDIAQADFPEANFDAIASIFFHLPSELRKTFHQNAYKWLKPGGTFIMEAFTPLQLGHTSGGPKDVDMLMTREIIGAEMQEFHILSVAETETYLSEGKGHEGIANVAQLICKK